MPLNFQNYMIAKFKRFFIEFLIIDIIALSFGYYLFLRNNYLFILFYVISLFLSGLLIFTYNLKYKNHRFYKLKLISFIFFILISLISMFFNAIFVFIIIDVILLFISFIL